MSRKRALASAFTKSNILVAVAVGLLTFSLWAYLNRPEPEPPWPQYIQGFSFSPLQEGESPLEHKFPTREELDKDLALLSGKVYAVRTYSMDSTLADVPALAAPYGINVALGAWIDKDETTNNSEVDKLIAVANKHDNVVRVLVGNEAILRQDVTVEQLAVYLKKVRAELGKPVSTAEPWHVWIKHPELAEHVDFLAVHMLPYWEGISVDDAVDYIVQHMKSLQALFPNKPIVITEVGWPSNGRTRHFAVASPSNEAIFLRRFLARAEQEGYIYYVMEAFDQPWKTNTEGAVGAYWGVYDVARHAKFAFKAPIVAIPQWQVLAGISIAIAVIILILLSFDSSRLRARGRSFLAVIAYTAATVAVWIVYQYVQQYLTVTSIVVGVLVLIGMIGVIVVILTEAHEWAESLWTRKSRRALQSLSLDLIGTPRISIHVPTYNEPPAMVIETLNALAELDYPNYEVIVIDNNTKDPSVWQPVQRHCEQLGESFRFFHVDPLDGFKAGALNYALAHSDPEAEIIGVIDSDYVVKAEWLRDLVPQFANPRVAIVQAPQDYRDENNSAFKKICYDEYRGFFFIGMITRNERNAIIQHGTMTLVRKAALEEVGGWAPWCITEDAELGLSLFEHGYEALYIPESYGRGLMPDTFLDYKKQRFRWAYGAVQIVRHHLRAFLSLRGRAHNKLSLGQKYHFIAGWLPWFADAANLLFNIAALIWVVAMLLFPRQVDPPLLEFSILPAALFVFKIGKMIYVYRTRVKASFVEIIGAAISGLSLSHTIATAVLRGLLTRNQPFMRTPKLTPAHPLISALGAVRFECLMMLALQGAAYSLLTQSSFKTLDMQVWILVLLVQSIPYVSAVAVAILSAFPGLRRQATAHPVA